MPRAKTPPAIAVVHAGVTVYRTYHDDDLSKPARYVFTLDPDDTDADDGPGVFDVRQLDVPSASAFTTEEPISPQADAANLDMDDHEYRRSPYWVLNLEQWERWRNVRQPALILEVLVEAIDQGVLVP